MPIICANDINKNISNFISLSKRAEKFPFFFFNERRGKKNTLVK